MRLTRVHVDAPLVSGSELALPEGPAVHLARVLRLGVGDECVLFNGDGHDYRATVTVSSKRELKVMIGAATAVANESPLRIVLLQGIARGEKMDLILQKATELGVAAMQPLHSQRSEIKLDAARAAKRWAHWRNVVIAACEQSGRSRVPEVAAPLSLADAVANLPPGSRRLILDPEGVTSFSALELAGTEPVLLAIGPEGGWSRDDLARLDAAGFRGLRLGPRILRTETAGLAVIAALQARFGDLA